MLRVVRRPQVNHHRPAADLKTWYKRHIAAPVTEMYEHLDHIVTADADGASDGHGSPN